MALGNTSTRYGAVSKSFHWLTALLILTLIPLGLFAENLPYETQEELARKAWFFSLHKTLGVTVFFVAFLRILWALSQPKPGLLNADKKLESCAAEAVHWLLYAALVVVPLSGWIGHAAAAGFAPIWWPFGQGLPLIPKNTAIEHAAGAVHWLGTKILIATLLLHVAGALKHHVIDRDATLRRMLPGEPAIGPLPDQLHRRTPEVAALTIWAGVLVIGILLGLSGGSENGAAEAAALEDVASDWEVQTGTIAIGVVQFGSEVEGSFADWTAAISFDETVDQGIAGNVTTTISIPSLSLGSVTDQAMGPDFFHASAFPTARFVAEIKTGPDGYLAEGTLSIKDNAVPISLPFQLTINADTAEMRADTKLDRRDFGIGATMTDESSLGFGVKVKITLTATRAD